MNAEVMSKCEKARQAASTLAACSTTQKNSALDSIADFLEKNIKNILEANKLDLDRLEKEDHYTEAFRDRLLLNEARIFEMAQGLREISVLKDPIGEVTKMWKRPNGLEIGQTRVPIGVIAIIYEARPNVTVDASGLTLKAGNAVILRGSSEALHSNRALVKLIRQGLLDAGLPEDSVALIEDSDRAAVQDLLKANQYLDLLIPRGGPSLIETVINNASVPVIQTGAGNCHIYVDDNSDLDKALAIAINAKVQRPGVCNAMETLLVHQDVADDYLTKLIPALEKKGVEIRGCPQTVQYSTNIKPAVDEDWNTEFLDLILAVKVVENIDQAVEHINKHGTGHSEAIITDSYSQARYFLKTVDAAAVYVNASTRFTDGSAFGLGAEIGISTQKLHARGPMGLETLTALKYFIFGSGQVRE